MIKSVMQGKNGRRLILLGLSYRNLNLLRDGMPIKIAGKEIGVDDLDVAIYAGKDEADLLEQLKKAGINVDDIEDN